MKHCEVVLLGTGALLLTASPVLKSHHQGALTGEHLSEQKVFKPLLKQTSCDLIYRRSLTLTFTLMSKVSAVM